jgi:ribonuclease BN (tRNA processing enzyme)
VVNVPLHAVEGSQDRLVVLGAKGGPAIRKGGPSPTAHLLVLDARPFVVDCGLGVTRGLVEAGLALPDIETILITHLHSDHVLELGPLLHTAWTAGLKRRVIVHGPAGTQALWDAFCVSMAFDIALRIEDEGRPDLRTLVHVVEYAEGPVLTAGGVSVTALRVNHPPVTDCFALRFKSGSATVVFSADTTFHLPLADFASGCDVLVHEAMYGPGVDRLVARVGNGARLRQHLMDSHTLVEDVGRIASAAEAKLLVLGHLVPADDLEVRAQHWIDAVATTYSGPVVVARDGLTISLQRTADRPHAETAGTL